MILGFMQKFAAGKRLKGKPTNFKPKILAGIKIHTMREDVHNRWRVGMKMTLAHGVRTKVYDPFLEVDACPLIQEVYIKYSGKCATPEIFIDGRKAGMLEMIMLATNDGFDNFDDFLDYFCETKVYRLLHWTDYKYDGDVTRIKMVNDSLKDINQM